MTLYTNGAVSIRGIRLTYVVDQKLDGVSQPWWITYVMQGKPKKGGCPVGPVAYGNWNGGLGNMTLTAPVSGISGDAFSSEAYQCRSPLPLGKT